jgi:hypothetical protein
VECPLSRVDGSVVYNCFWPSPAQSLSTSPTGLMTIFYCLRFETPPGPCIYIPQEQFGPIMPPGTGFPFRRLLRLVGLQWRYSNSPRRRVLTLKFLLHDIQEFGSYLTGNLLRLRYEDQRLVQFRETIAVYCENHTKHKDTLWGKGELHSFIALKHVVPIVTTEL